MNTNDNLFPTAANELIKDFSDMVKNFGKREENWKESKVIYEKKNFRFSKKKENI